MSCISGWSCVFHSTIGKSQVILYLFVDDMIMMTNNRDLVNNIIQRIKDNFETKIVNDGTDDINNYDILGLEIEYMKGHSLKMGMEKQLEEKLPKHKVSLNKPRNVLGTPNEFIMQQEFYPAEKEYKNKVKWLQQVIGFASYVGYKYRYDTLYYVNTLARHTLYLSNQVISLAKQLIQFLWSTRRKKLIWNKSDNKKGKIDIVALTDASFANQENLKSQFGNMFFINGKLIGARSSKSTITCTSSTESEIYAICESIPLALNISVLVKSITDKTVNCIIYHG